MTAWTVTALERLKIELESDSRLSTYVDTVETWPRHREGEMPAVTRHGISLTPLAEGASEVHSPSMAMDTFQVRLRLHVAVWDPTDRSASILANNVVGVGTSEVGVLQFVEDVKNALRKNSLSDLLIATGTEADGGVDYSTVIAPERDHVFHEADVTWTGLRKHAMARTS